MAGLPGEARRVLAPGGQCVVSTPNKDYYADSRGRRGPNPYHVHEFSFEEFRQELQAVFPHVSLFLQNHVEGVVFQPAGQLTPAEVRVDRDAGNPAESHFFLAVCALSPQTGAPTFLYVPSAANVLREREQHIEKLGEQIAEINQDRTQSPGPVPAADGGAGAAGQRLRGQDQLNSSRTENRKTRPN